MTGTGIETDPYIVNNVADFRTACAESGAYVKLGANIYCDAEWGKLTISAVDVDFNNFFIMSPYATGTNLIEASSSTVIHDGQIVGIREDSFNDTRTGMTNVFVNGTYNRFGFSMEIDALKNSSSAFFNKCSIEDCNIEIIFNNVANRSITPFYKGSLKHSNVKIITPNNTEFEYFAKNDGQYSYYITNNRIEANVKKLVGFKGGGTSYCYLYLRNNTILTKNTSGSLVEKISGYTEFNVSNNVYNSDLATFSSQSGLKACTTEQLQSPEYLNSIGFTVIEKEVS